MLTDTLIEDPRWGDIDLSALAERAATTTLSQLGLDPSTWNIAVLACDDARIATLNADFRGKPQPTNVLSWPRCCLYFFNHIFTGNNHHITCPRQTRSSRQTNDD